MKYVKRRAYKIKITLIVTSDKHIDDIIKESIIEAQSLSNRLVEKEIDVTVGQTKVYDTL